ncbi:hypothetical protein M413DRAFT_445092 [Hebeloma cylindrosporum]|uniref:DUF7770 domain-containing protein n=1 Tax=Hebeloma cylindrosporum TaxID=76867 RepID=A0A0C3BZ64_HEBCY|nr:hypothetical protein M413DRAFT_445092 [Hebeloma cylindrosporum h7]
MVSTAPAKPINLDKYKAADDGGRIVTAISIFGVPTYPKVAKPGDGAHLVHWRVHLRWAGKGVELAKGSVVLDTYKDDAADPIIRVDVYSKPTLVSTAASKHWEFQAPVIKSGLSVQTVVDLITANGRQGYKYDGNGSGCLSWSATLLGDYVTAGYVDAKATEAFKEFIENTRKAEKAYWIPEDKGTYIPVV